MRFYLFVLLMGVFAVHGTYARTVRIGVMLPLQDAQGNTSARAVDFYRGMMMAVDSLRKDGTNYRIFTYNTANTSIHTILNDTIIKHLDIIFGPDTDESLKMVSEATKPYHTKIVNVFSPSCTVIKSNPYFYTLYAPQDVLVEQVAVLLNKYMAGVHPNVVILDTGKPTHALVGAVKKRLGKVRFLQMPYTDAQFKSRLNEKKINWVVVSSSDEESVRQVLTQVVRWKKQNPSYDIRLLGYPQWENMSATLKSDMYIADTYIYSSYFNDQYSQRNRNFSKAYNSLFGTKMEMTRPVMAMTGFDCAYYMLNEGRGYTPLQNGISLMPYGGKNSGWMNGNALLIHYGQDGKKELIKY